MAGNAHANRHRTRPCKTTNCVFCKHRPKVFKIKRLARNHNGHRHNPAAGKKQSKHRG